MNRGLMLKAMRELWPVTLFCGVLLLLIETLLAYVLPTYQEQFAVNVTQIAFVRNIIEAMLGAELADQLGPEMFSSIPWVHPVVLAIVWVHAIICCTRVPAGEVDRGTIDITLGLPVSRWQMLGNETVVWIGSAAALLVMALIGSVLGGMAVDGANRPELSRRLIVIANLLCLYLATGGLAWLISALSNQRGRAMIAAFAVMLASFLLNYLGPFWPPAQNVAFLSVLSYYRPLLILRDGAWPVADMAILLAIAAGLWTAAGIVFARRDLCTV